MVSFVSSGSSLSAVVGRVGAEREASLRTRLLALDGSLGALAEEATLHVGDTFVHSPLRLHEAVREISGGVSAQVGDIWFEIWNEGPSRWEVSGAIPVHCDLMPRGYSCTHDLLSEQRIATSPEEAVEVLAALVADVREQLPLIPVAKFHRFPHADLPERIRAEPPDCGDTT